MSYFEDDEMLNIASEALAYNDEPLSMKHIPLIAHDIYKEMPFGMKAILWGAGLYAVAKVVKLGGKIVDKIRGPRPAKDHSLEDREELLRDMTEWWKKPTMQYNDNIHPIELFCGFELMSLAPIDVIKRCESKGDMRDETLKSLWEVMYRGENVSDEEWDSISSMEQHKKMFGKDRFRIIAGHDDYFYAYSAQKKKIYEFIAEYKEGFTINEVRTFEGSNEDSFYDTSKISAEDIKNIKAGKPVAPYKEEERREVYKIR